MIPPCFQVSATNETVRIEVAASANATEELPHAWLVELGPRRIEIGLRQLATVRSHLVAWLFSVRKALPQAEMHITGVTSGAAHALRLVGLERFVTIHKAE